MSGVLESTAAQAGYATIADIARARLKRAGEVVANGVGLIDSGFRSLKVDTTNMVDVLRTPDTTTQGELSRYVDSLKSGRSAEDLLFQVLLDWGLELTVPIGSETLDGQAVLVADEGALVACFEEAVKAGVVAAIAERQPLRVVFRDSGFATDADRINAEQIFAERSPATNVKTI